MVVGLPGTGIGGMFYLLAAVWAPVQEFWSWLAGRNRRPRWKLVLSQALIALSIIVGMWAVGEITGRLILAFASAGGIHLRQALNLGAIATGKDNILRITLLYWALATLAFVYLAVHVARFFVWLCAYAREYDYRATHFQPRRSIVRIPRSHPARISR